MEDRGIKDGQVQPLALCACVSCSLQPPPHFFSDVCVDTMGKSCRGLRVLLAARR